MKRFGLGIPIALLAGVGLFGAGPSVAQTVSTRDGPQTLLAELRANPRARSVAARFIAEADRALSRARNARASGDTRRARLLEAVAGQWAVSARDLARADAEEQATTKLERRLLAAQEGRLRAYALLEETMARVGRARAALDKLERGAVPEEHKDAGP